MTGTKADDLILKIGKMVIEDEEYQDNRWTAISVVATLGEGQSTMTGYQYFADGDSEPASPEEFSKVFDELELLRDTMKELKGDVWKKCLIQITKPDYKVNMQFEYEDMKRWTPEQISLDMSDFANSLRPQNPSS